MMNLQSTRFAACSSTPSPEFAGAFQDRMKARKDKIKADIESGELQADAAVSAIVGQSKAAGSPVASRRMLRSTIAMRGSFRDEALESRFMSEDMNTCAMRARSVSVCAVDR